MSAYIINYIFLCGVSILYDMVSNKRIRDMLFGIGCLSILFLTCFRDTSVGGDTQNYCDQFIYMRENLPWGGVFSYGWEPGYVALNKIIGIFFDSRQAFIIILGILSLLPVFWMIKRDSEFPCMSLVIFVAIGAWATSICTYRQWCAQVILLASYKYIQRRKFLPFAALVFCAMLFHRTAVMFLLAYFAYALLKIKTETLLVLMPCGMVLGIIGRPILVFLNRFARLPVEIEYNGGVNLLIFLWLCIIVIFLFNKRKIRQSKYRMYYCMLLIAGTLQPIVFTFSLWSRIIDYFSLSIIILFPATFGRIVDTKDNRRLKIPVEMVVHILFLCFYALRGLDMRLGEYLFMKL